MGTVPGDITRLLAEIRQGNREAETRLAELVYDELHRLAKYRMYGERADHTLQPTVLVSEAFVRLVRSDSTEWTSRNHFFAVAATMMRRILIDHARQVRAQKRGGGAKISLDTAIAVTDENLVELLALDEALTRLAVLDARQCRIVELRFFSGLSEDEIAEVLEISVRTVKREWKTARAWLHNQIAGPPD
jgi:RNA polymerase sigma-70 factor, ECF subfamily